MGTLIAPSRPLTKCQQALVEQWQYLIPWAIKRWCAPLLPQEHEECSGQCMEGLCRAAQLFNPKRRVKGKRGVFVQFKTYATWWVRQGITRYWELRNRRTGFVPGDDAQEPVPDKRHRPGLVLFGDCDLPGQSDPDDGGLEVILADNRLPVEVPLDVREQLELCRYWLPAKWWRVLWLRFAEGRTLEDIGKTMRVTKERVRQLQAKAMARLREKLGHKVTL